MENNNAIYLIVAVLVLVFIMTQMKREKMSGCGPQVRVVNSLPRGAKRCALVNHGRCNMRPYDMPDDAVLYYGNDENYLAKRVNPNNTFHMCAGSNFGHREPNVPSERRQCWVGSEAMEDQPMQREQTCLDCPGPQPQQQGPIDEEPVGEPEPVPSVLDHGEEIGF
jgi:hypothetical protein